MMFAPEQAMPILFYNILWDEWREMIIWVGEW